MTFTKSPAAKLSVVFVALAMVFTMFAPSAKAQSTDDLQQMINDLLAQVASLQSQLGQGGTSVASGVCPYTWTRDLSQGSTGGDVMKLQQFLNADADTRVAATGAGSVGAETEYYGPATAAAVSKMQVKYRADILSPAGLVNPTGYFGPSSRAKANMLCTTAPVVDGGDDMDEEDEDTDSTPAGLTGGEADVNSMEGSDEEDEVAEGEEDVAVHNIEFDVEDGDVMLKRIDVTLDNSAIGNDGESDPWDAFDEISIWVDGDKVASEDVTDEDDWDEDGSEFVFRLTGLDVIFREDTTGEVIIAVSAQSGVDVDGDSTEDDWDIFVDEDGMRFIDSEGIDISEPASALDASTFEIIEEGENDDLNLESSDEDPDATTFALDEDDEMEYAIFAFDLSADDSDNDISLNDITVHVTIANQASLNAFVDDFRLEIDGESFDAESYTGSGTEADVMFDIDGDVEIEADETVTAVLYANFDDVSSGFTYGTIMASTSAGDIDAEGADDVTVDGSDSLEGNTHTVRLAGLDVEYVSSDTDIDENNDQTSADDEGVFTLEFDVTAFGEDLYIPFGAGSSTAGLGNGVLFTIRDNSGNSVDLTGATTTISLDVEDGDVEENNSYKIDEGTTETLTLEVKYDPATTGAYRLQLEAVQYALSDVATATVSQNVSGQTIRTSKLTI